MSNYWKKKLDELEKSKAQTTTKATSTTNYWQNKMTELEKEQERKKKTEDIAPVKQTVTKDDDRKWFEKGLFEDGYQFGDITKTILGTGEDTRSNLLTGIIGMGEKVLDAGATLGAMMNQGAMNEAAQNEMMYNFVTGKKTDGVLDRYQKYQDQVEDETAKFVAKDLYNEEAVAKKIVNASVTSQVLKGMGAEDVDSFSVLGEKSDTLVQSAGQLAATAGLQAVGVPWWLTTGATTFGSEAENAFIQGADYDDAVLSATVSAGAEILTEKLSGGISFGGKTLDGALTKELGRVISNKTARILAKMGIDMVGEGAEEVLSGVMSALGQKMSYADEKELNELFSSEDALESFIGGVLLGGGGSVVNSVKSNVKGVDPVTELTKNEQAVVDKVYNDTVAEAEKNGKITAREKRKIYDQVLNDFEKGYISTDTIEEALGGETYKTYQDTIANEDAIKEEFDTLNKMKQGEMTGEQIDRRTELKQQLEDLKTNSQREQLKSQLSDEVFNLAKDTRLAESYNERSRRGQAFEADVSKYDAKQQAVVQNAIDSGILNNTNRTHEFVDMIAKISADKGVSFDFTDNAKLRESGFSVDGATINGYVTKDGITLNIDSSKATRSVAGHEITHILEGTELYTELQNTIFEYAKTKGEYDSRLATLTKLYESVDGADVNAELTADLVGDYLFTDADFVKKLSVEHRNIFEKIYDEIKYMLKVATAGSKEARELEKVKKAFEDAYRAEGKASGTKFSLENGKKRKYNKHSKHSETESLFLQWENGSAPVGEVKRFVRYGKIRYFEKTENGCVELSKSQYNERNGAYVENTDRRAEREIGKTNDYDGSTQRGTLGDSDGHRNARGNAAVFGQTVREELRYGTARGTSSTLGHDNRNDINQSVLLEEALDNSGASSFIPDNNDVQYSLTDNSGKELSKGQQDYFKDSKMRDDDGNLMVMYHGSQDAGFHEFNSQFSDDDTSFFFVDRNDVAASYSGTSEVYEARTMHTAEDVNNFIAEIGAEGYDVVESDGKYSLLYEGDRVADSDSAKGIFDEFRWYEGVGEGDANYKVYLNLTNPLVVDAKGKNWNNVSREYSQEVADRYHSLTAEEKAALTDLAEWGEYGVFKDEMLEARATAEQGGSGVFDEAYTKTLARAYEKLGGANANLYDAFTIASDNFSEESIKQFAAKQMTTRDYAQKAKAEGYDGVIFKNIHDNGGYSNGDEGASTVAIAFDSNQIKSTANTEPTKDADIRYSLSDSDGNKLSKGQADFFKDSKARDNDGNLQVVYHGSKNSGFNVFQYSKDIQTGTDYGEAFYFTSDFQKASGYSYNVNKDTRVAQYQKEKDALIKKFLETHSEEDKNAALNYRLEGKSLYDLMNDEGYQTEGGEVKKVYLNLKNPLIVDAGGEYYYKVYDEYFEQARKSGNDGIIVKNVIDNPRGEARPIDTYIAFKQEQIKSVDNTNPTADPDIRYSLTEYTDEEKKAHNDIAREHFGKTYMWAETGYLLLDGTKLDMSGKHDGAPGGYRTVDHRDIVDALGSDYGDGSYSGSLVQFMSEGNIRIIPEMGGINLSVKPTEAQEKALADYVMKHRGEVVLDIDDANGYTVVSVEYPAGTRSSKVLGDIRAYFEDGTKPEYSLSRKGATHRYGRGDGPMSDLALKTDIAPVAENAEIADAPIVENAKPMTTDDMISALWDAEFKMQGYDPNAEADASEQAARDAFRRIGDKDAPPETEAPYYGESEPERAADPFLYRDWDERTTKAFTTDNPDVKRFFQEEAERLAADYAYTMPAERGFNADVYYNTNGERGFYGWSRQAADDINTLLDVYGLSYAQIADGLDAIIHDTPKVNNKPAKTIEFILNKRMLKGYKAFYSGEYVPPNQAYIEWLNEQQSEAEWQESTAALTDADAPMVEDVAPVAPMAESLTVEDVMPIAEAPIAPHYEAIRPQSATEVQTAVAEDLTDDSEPQGGKAKERKWVGTSTESEAVNREILPDDLDQDAIHYQPIPNKVTLGNANSRLNSMGYDMALTYFNSQFVGKKVTLDDIALGERLIQEAIKRGDKKTAGELIQNVSILGTELGQKVQALSIIKKLTPEGQLKMLQKVVERGKAKGDKAYDGVEVTQDMVDDILGAYGKDGSYDQDKLNKAVEDAKQKLADQMKVTFMDKVNAWRYLSMLGNPKTHIRNLVSNVAMKGTTAVKNAIARTIEDIAPVKNRTKTRKPSTDYVKSFAEKTAIEMQDVLQDGGKYSEDASIKAKRKIFKSHLLNWMSDGNSDLLSKEDWWFSKPAFENAFAECLTANGIRTEEEMLLNPEIVEKARAYATEQSQIATFRQYSWLSNKIHEIEQKNAATQIAVGAILPFKKTPVNIAKAGLSYSPLGFAKTLTYDVAQVKNGKMEASELVDHLAQNITGSALTLVGYLLAKSGFLSGGGDDDKEGKYDYQLGEQSYSVNIGGKSYSLSWLSPVAMPLFVGTNAYETLVEKEEWDGDVVIQTLAETLDPLSEMSFLSGLDSVLSSYESGVGKFLGIGEAMAQNYATQFVPTLSSQVATVMDDTKRSTKASRDSGWRAGEETLNKLLFKIPVLRQTLEPSTDIWGNDIKQTENVAARAVETFIAPYAVRENTATEIDAEIKDLYSETGDNGILPAIPDNYVNYKDEKYEMSADDFTAFKKAYGQTAYDMLGELFDTNTYRTADAELRADLVNRVYDYARDEAKREYLAKQGVEYTNATEDNVPVYKEDAIKGAIYYDVTPEEYTFMSEYPEKYDFFKENGISYDTYKNAGEDGKRAYTWAYENPSKYTMSKVISDDLMTFYKYKSDLGDIYADKDEDGKSISGSAKEKKMDYINGLDLDYGQKIILHRSMYDSKADKEEYNLAIVEYLDSREDISWEDMKTILEELDFTVYDDGRITW